MSDTDPKLRRLQFSWRARFAVCTCVVICLAGYAWELHQRSLLRAEILASPNAVLLRDITGRVTDIDLRSANFSERDQTRAEAIFPGVRVLRTPPFYWDFFYRNPDPNRLRDPC